MAEPTLPNLADDMRRIHAIITRGLDVALDNLAALAAGELVAAPRGGFLDYVQSLATVLHAHHLLEDELAFPFVRAAFPEIPYDHLMLQHREMEPHIEAAHGATVSLRMGADADALAKLRDALTKLEATWPFHIEVEESHVTQERVAERLSPKERVQLAEGIGEFNRTHLAPDFLIIPFLLFNLPPEQRALFARPFPPVVTDQLVPGPWRQSWAPMQPYLLD